jgi:anti-sigma factor ChrR (cupin superfamily)
MVFTRCPDELTLVRYADQRLLPPEQEQMNAHLGRCDNCREFLILFNQINEEKDLLPSLTNDEIQRTTNTVLDLIEQDYNGKQRQKF